AGPRVFHWKTRLPTAFNAVGGSVLCHSRARGGFCQVALLVACYQGAQCSRWRRPRRPLATVDSKSTPVARSGGDRSPRSTQRPLRWSALVETARHGRLKVHSGGP